MNYNKAELCKDCKKPVIKRRDWHKSPVWEDEEIYDYLDELVESGKFPSEGSSSRMALARYLQRKYGMDRGQAKRILLAWSKIRRKDCKMPVEKITEEEQEGTIIMDLLDDIARNRDIDAYARSYAKEAYTAYRMYGMRGLKTQVIYVLNNLRSWRGPEAKRIKARLKRFTR